MRNKFLIFLFFKFILINNISTACDSDPKELILNSLNGKLKGSCYNLDVYYSNKSIVSVPIISWLSIPYAEPPVGKKRFKNPLPIKPWLNTRDARGKPNACIQFPLNNQSTLSEDCLYLSIDAPFESFRQKNKTNRLPIFVWIHGGAFRFGSVNDYYSGYQSALENLISIRINYRLGPFGWMRIEGTEAKGNQAILDQNLALKWIYENAERFGGDKNKITISGESAGSWSVGYHLLYKPSWPYFTNVIQQSGVPATLDIDTFLVTSKQATSLSKQFGAFVNCKQTNNQKFLECLQSVDKENINLAFFKSNYPQFVMDSNLVFDKHPKLLLQRGEFKKTNVLVGMNNFEQAFLAADEVGEFIEGMRKGVFGDLVKALNKRLRNASLNQINQIVKVYIPSEELKNSKANFYNYFIKMISDYQYVCPTYEYAEYISKYNNNNTYVYLYAQKPSNTPFAEFDGATHTDEIQMMFGYPMFDNKTYTENEKIFGQQMVDWWMNFVKFDKPTNNGEWPKFRDTKSNVNRNVYFLRDQQIKNTLISLENNPCKMWNELKIINYYL